MAARDRNAKMPELKQPLLLSGALAATGSVAGQGIGLISPIRPRPRCARAWRRARPWRASPAGQELALVCGKMDLARTRSASAAASRRRRRRARDGKTQDALAAFYQASRPMQVATLAINISLYAQELPAGSGCPATRRAAGRPSRRSSCRAWGTRTPYCSACARPAWT